MLFYAGGTVDIAVHKVLQDKTQDPERNPQSHRM